MKHIKKFNTNEAITIKQSDVKDYLDECFIEIIDNQSIGCVHYREISDRSNLYTLFIDYSKEIQNFNADILTSTKMIDISDRINEYEKIVNFWKKLKSCSDKAKLEYPSLKINTKHNKLSMELSILVSSKVDKNISTEIPQIRLNNL